ncbi:MAG TPA: hypothetical protein VH764_09910 [Gemmatimonadales bacterium]|jgi:hypothetical protein
MKRRVGLLSLVTCALAACSGGREEMRGPAAGDASTGGDQGSPGGDGGSPQSVSITNGTVPMKVKIVMGKVNYSEAGTGECASSTESSIYDVPATQWHATYGGDGSNIQHLNLTVWRPRDGAPDMVSLYLQSGETTHQIATVKGGPMKGGGTASVRPTGKGGTLSVSGKDDDGHPVELTVECERFDEVVAEGG